MVLFDYKALTPVTVVPSLLALALADYFSAGMLASVYVMGVVQAKLSLPEAQLAIKDVPVTSKCLIIGVNDYVESYNRRWNHSCGYINYIDHEVSDARKGLKAGRFVQAVERYGDLYDIVFPNRGVEIDIGLAISSVAKESMGMGKTSATPLSMTSKSGIADEQLENVVIVSRLGGAEDFYGKIDGLKRWAAKEGSADAWEKDDYLKTFGMSISDASGQQCSKKFLNLGDCLRDQADSIFTLHWDKLAIYAVYVVALYAIYVWTQSPKVKDTVGLCVQIGILGSSMLLGALLIGAIGANPDEWDAWYSAGEGNLHVQNILLVAVLSRGIWKGCGTMIKQDVHHVVEEADRLDTKLGRMTSVGG